MKPHNYYDVLILGSGVAGLSTALHLQKSNKKVAIVSKINPKQSSTYHAQGGVAVSLDLSDINEHIQDTLNAGIISNKKAVDILCSNSIEAISELIDLGLDFDKDRLGNLLYGMEGAHSTKRILHIDGDATGKYLYDFLIRQNKYPMINATITDLLIENNICHGISIQDDQNIKNIYAKNIVIATGGVASLFKYSTNPSSICGDLQAIALSKNIELTNMEMIQFHPTVYIGNEKTGRKLLLSEALRGEGAYIIDKTNKRFLFDYDSRAELAPRDIVSRSIVDYKIKNNTEVYLSFEKFTKEFFEKRFPNIYNALSSQGFSLPHDKIPISPAAHYTMGGIKTNFDGLVGDFLNLYSVGEVANVGIHGANRLASNSLLEGLVFSKIVSENIINKNNNIKIKEFRINQVKLTQNNDDEIFNSLQNMADKYIGVHRNKKDLSEFKKYLNLTLKENIGEILKNRINLLKKITSDCLNNTENIGAHNIK